MVPAAALPLRPGSKASAGASTDSSPAASTASAVVWILHGQVLWALAIPALACSIAGNYLGALYAIRGGSRRSAA